MRNLYLEPIPGYDPFKIQDFFDRRVFAGPDGQPERWRPEIVKFTNFSFYPVTFGAPLGCPDGRFDWLEKKN